METATILAAARAQLSEGQIAQALQALIAGLKSEPRFADAVRTLRVLESNYVLARQQELKGILAFADAQRAYAQVTDSTLAILDDIEAGRTPLAAITGAKNRRRNLLLVGLGLAFLVAVVLFFFLKDRPKCPDFEQKQALKVLILPFQNVGAAQAKPALVLQNRIRQLTAKNQLAAEVGILKNYDSDAENPDERAASQFCQKCLADLVLWGQYSVGSDSSRVSIQYKFYKTGRAGGTDVLAFKDITALQSGSMVRGLDDAIFSICTMIALREERWDLAHKWLDKIKEKSAMDVAVGEWLTKNQR